MPDSDSFLDRFIAEEGLPAAFRETVAALHEPLAGHIAAFAERSDRPILVGLCGPQASGKSTGVAIICRILERLGHPTVDLALDDFYLTRAERQELARRVHPLFVTRGPPATHDMALCGDVIGALLDGRQTAIPVFSKTADDRLAVDGWRRCHQAPAVILFEGWCVGATAQPDRLEREEDPQAIWRRHANEALAGRYREVFERMAMLIQLRPPGFEIVAHWRREQESKLREKAAPANPSDARIMSDSDIDRFVAHYERLTRWIATEMPGRADIVVDLDPARAPTRWRIGANLA